MTGTAYFLGVLALSAVAALFFIPGFRSWVSRSIGGQDSGHAVRSRSAAPGRVAKTLVPDFTIRLSLHDRVIVVVPVVSSSGSQSIGRAVASDIVVPDDAEFRAVSSRHVLVECTSSDVHLTDVSTNGTFRASGARLTKGERTKIAPGENIFLGAASGPPMIRVERV